MSRMHNPAHPGEVLREWIPESMTVSQAAEQLGVSRVTLSKILNGKAGLTADMALRLAAWLNTSAEVWADMQTQWEALASRTKPAPHHPPPQVDRITSSPKRS